jgi:succinyl-diaminopimelate desuccinylase
MMLIGDLILKYQDEMIADLQALIAIRSVASTPTDSCPFGEGPAAALQFMLQRARSFGLEVVDVDGYAGHAQISGGPEIAGILVHLDTVPEGEGWTIHPFSGTIHEGMIYGRGVSDNKGPAISSLYALRALKEAGVHVHKTLRVIFGTAEETSQQDMAYYFKRYPVPDLAFTPDVGPAIYYAEMGIYTLQLVRTFGIADTSPIISMQAGVAANMVPDRCSCLLHTDQLHPDSLERLEQKSKQYEFIHDYTLSPDKAHIITRGTSAHGSVPQFGVNAIVKMIEWLHEMINYPDDADSEIHQTLQFIDRYLAYEVNGHSLGIACRDELTGSLIVNMGMLQLDHQQCAITLNIRHPATVDQSFVMQGLQQIAHKHDFQVTSIHYMPPVYVPIDHPLIAKLSRAHQIIMGEPPALVTTPGGTYAKWLNNQGVGYGGVWSEGFAHQADERIRLDEWMQLSRILTQAAYEISQP